MVYINGKTYTDEYFKEAAFKAKSKTQLAKKFGFKKLSSRAEKEILKAANAVEIDPEIFTVRYEEYKVIEKDCPICGTKFTTKKNHPREQYTCSTKCSGFYFSYKRHTPEANSKTSATLLKRAIESGSRSTIEEKCLECESPFFPKDKAHKFCSRSCGSKYRGKQDTYRKHISDKAKERVANGTHKGWQSRTKLKPSYAEQYIINLLEQLNITATREYKVDRWFIDFADTERKLALEIDGKQHELPERKLSDQKKDAFLTCDGWTVLRIKWRKVTDDFHKYLVEIIQKFFQRY